MSLRTSIRRQASEIKNYRDLPSWWTVLQVGIGVIFVLFIAYKLIAPEPEVDPYNAYLAETESELGIVNTEEELTESTTGSGGTVPAAPGATTDLAMQDGTGDVPVADEALAVGTAAAEAVFTTDFTAVPLATGAEIPPLPMKFEDPKVSEPLVASYAETLIIFSFVVDPDGDNGPEGLRQINVTVAKDGDRWGYTGG